MPRAYLEALNEIIFSFVRDIGRLGALTHMTRTALLLLMPTVALMSCGSTGGGGDGGSEEMDAGRRLASTTAKAITSGSQHSCALTANGSVRCWGYADYGAVGNGGNIESTDFIVEPGEVPTAGTGNVALSVASGGAHTCVVTSAGGVKCWGANNYGQLGNGTTTDSSTAVDVIDLNSGVKAVAVGELHTCALMNDGAVKCWGYTESGRLGHGDQSVSGRPIAQKTPVDVLDLPGPATSIAAGYNHSCAVLGDGRLTCWGANSYAQLGNGTVENQVYTAAVVAGLSGVTVVTTGHFNTCAVVGAAVKCWGNNGHGEAGNGERDQGDVVTPSTVAGLTGVTSMTSGFDYVCAVAAAGVKCWGSNSNGVLGSASEDDATSPATSLGVTAGIKAVAGAYRHTCALTLAGEVKCWGSNEAGVIGSKSVELNAKTSAPVGVTSLP